MRAAPARPRVRRPLVCENLEVRAVISDSLLSALAIPALSTAASEQFAEMAPPPLF